MNKTQRSLHRCSSDIILRPEKRPGLGGLNRSTLTDAVMSTKLLNDENSKRAGKQAKNCDSEMNIQLKRLTQRESSAFQPQEKLKKQDWLCSKKSLSGISTGDIHKISKKDPLKGAKQPDRTEKKEYKVLEQSLEPEKDRIMQRCAKYSSTDNSCGNYTPPGDDNEGGRKRPHTSSSNILRVPTPADRVWKLDPSRLKKQSWWNTLPADFRWLVNVASVLCSVSREELLLEAARLDSLL